MQLAIFYLYLMLHACAVRFDVVGNLKKFLAFGRKFTKIFGLGYNTFVCIW